MTAVASTPQATAAPAGRKVSFADESAYRPRERALLRHNFTDHPLLQLPRLEQFAESLKNSGQVKWLAKGTSSTSHFGTLNQSDQGVSIAETFARIEQPGSWISLYNVESDPEYRALLQEAVESAAPVIQRRDPGIFGIGGFIFISAPPSVTPFHIDRENNLLLQIRGRKRFKVWDPADRATVSAEAIEQFIVTGDLSKVQLTESAEQRCLNADLGAGEGVYMPSTAAHLLSTEPYWVQEGAGYSVTIAIVFYTAATRRMAHIHAMNRLLRRKLGVTPTPPNESALADSIKAAAGSAYFSLRSLKPGYKPMIGF